MIYYPPIFLRDIWSFFLKKMKIISDICVDFAAVFVSQKLDQFWAAVANVYYEKAAKFEDKTAVFTQ